MQLMEGEFISLSVNSLKLSLTRHFVHFLSCIETLLLDANHNIKSIAIFSSLSRYFSAFLHIIFLSPSFFLEFIFLAWKASPHFGWDCFNWKYPISLASHTHRLASDVGMSFGKNAKMHRKKKYLTSLRLVKNLFKFNRFMIKFCLLLMLLVTLVIALVWFDSKKLLLNSTEFDAII